MHSPANSPAPGRRTLWLLSTALAVGVVAVAGITYLTNSSNAAVLQPTEPGTGRKPAPADPEPEERAYPVAPELDGGVAWLNTAGPIKLKDLKGKIVVLDFWTLCCINCIHTLPELAKLEKKYPNELVVIGIHSAKFENEKNTESIRKAVLRYQVTHPVVNDAEMRIWRTYGSRSWPTLVLIDPEGKAVWADSGEGICDDLDKEIAKLVKTHKAKKTLNERPLHFALAHETGDSPLFFPGKVLADADSGRLFTADSTHHRIVITDLDGKKIAIAGAGTSGKDDGAFDKATFNDPQGLALNGDTLYVADRKKSLDPRSRPEGEDGENDCGHRQTGSKAAGGRPGARDRLEQPVGPAIAGGPPLYRHGRPSPNLGAGFEKGKPDDLRRHGPRRHHGRGIVQQQFRPAEWLDDGRQKPLCRRQ